MKKKILSKRLGKLSLSMAAVFLMLGLFVSVAQASPPAQDPRDPFDSGGPPGGDDDGGDGGGDGHEGSSSAITCGHISGQVINWGYRPEPEVPVVLKTGSWETSAITIEDGSYVFGNLGVGLAELNALVASQDPLKPLTPDALVYLTCDFPTVANVALHSAAPVEPPVILTMAASSTILNAAKNTRITLTIENTLPTDISNVILTNGLPFGLKALDVSTSVDVPSENLRILNGGRNERAVVVYLDTIAAGETETVELTVTLIEDTPPDTQITNTATLFYRESVAVQASLDFEIGSTTPVIQAAMKVGSEDEAATAEVASDRETKTNTSATQAETASAGQTRSASTTTTDTQDGDDTSRPSDTEEMAIDDTVEDEPATADDLLPVTGEKELPGSHLIQADRQVGSIIGVGLILMAFAAYIFRTVYWRVEES